MKRATLLVVDDEAPMRKLLLHGLQDSGFEVASVASGEEGLRFVANEPPVCVLLDIGLPGLSGLETLRELRKFSQVPCIMLTVEADDDAKVEALSNGADDFVTKPFSMPVLRARIKAVLRRQNFNPPGSTEREVYQTEGLRVDFSARRVWANENEVHLTLTEFELIELFIKNAGRVLTHQKILATIWGNQAGDQMHYLRVYINNLRRKIEANPSIPQLLITEPGVGYRFEGLNQL